MHVILAKALSELGVAASTCQAHAPQLFAGLLCFQHFTPGDLVIEGAKVTGSAQRRQRGALLQHGSVLLAGSPFAPALPGIKELTGRCPAIGNLCQTVTKHFADMTGWDLSPGPWNAQETGRIEILVNTRYAKESWNQKR
jgi:lipoate-protein ligase A